MLLALDTATPAITVALVERDGRLLAQSSAVDARRHGELLAPVIEGVLDEAGVDRRRLSGIVVGVGPGPFTGLRVGIVTAAVLGRVLDLPVAGVCTLDALALAAPAQGPFLAVTDARRREVFWAAYDPRGGGALPHRSAGPAVCAPGDVPGADVLPAFGFGALAYPAQFADPRSPDYPAAADLARWFLAGGELMPVEPVYLRRPDASEPGARKPVLR